MEGFDTALSICLGLGLAAACGFRIFVPMLIMNLAMRGGYLELSEGMAWMGSTPALIVFGVATALEIGAYYVPWVDNALDAIATPAAVVAGVVVSASAITGIDPMLKWSLALIAGGSLAGTVQAATGVTRFASTATTGGLGNPLVSTAEAGAAVGLSALAILVPLVAAALVATLIVLLARRWMTRRSRRLGEAAL